jgi:hypothetical protein
VWSVRQEDRKSIYRIKKIELQWAGNSVPPPSTKIWVVECIDGRVKYEYETYLTCSKCSRIKAVDSSHSMCKVLWFQETAVALRFQETTFVLWIQETAANSTSCRCKGHWINCRLVSCLRINLCADYYKREISIYIHIVPNCFRHKSIKRAMRE